MTFRERAVVAAQVFALALAAAVGSGCASDTPPSSDDGQGGDDPTSGSGGGPGGGGGLGGGTGSCDQDCSEITTGSPCLQAVCNEGEHPGTIGECTVVPSDPGTSCDDGVFCTVSDTCSDGMCVGGPQNDCGMEPPVCTTVTCDEGTQTCSSGPADNGSECVAPELCTVNAKCQNGLCIGAPKDCTFSPLTECNQVSCNPASGKCEGTADATKDGAACALSGDACMVQKTCLTGQCVGGVPKDCSALTVGCQNGVCNSASGFCEGEPVPPGGVCFDAADQCNTGLCDNNGMCQPMPIANGTVCNDYNSCTTGDVCTLGACDGSPISGCLVYFEASFETCPDGWTLANDWECGAPINVGPPSAHSGTGVMGTIIDGNYNNGQTWAATVAESPPIDLSTATEPGLSMWVWIQTEGGTYDGAHLEISTNDGASYSVLTTVFPPYDLMVASQPAWGEDQSALGWQNYLADLSAYAGQQIRLRFAFQSDGSIPDAGFYVDDMSIAEAKTVQLTITTPSPLEGAFVNQAYTAPLARAGGSSGAVWSIVGGTNHSWLAIDSGTGALSGTPAVANAGPGTVVVRVEEPTFPTNFIEKTLAFQVGQLVYFETFEGACPNGWTLAGDWQCGVPSVVGPATAFSGTQCMATNIAGFYANGQTWATANATSPSIDLTGISGAKLSFRAWVNTEGSTYDGFNLKVSTDGGTNFTTVTTVTPAYPLTINLQPAWGGDESAAGWQIYEADLAAFSGQPILLRFGFQSDASINDPGVYIDNFAVSY